MSRMKRGFTLVELSLALALIGVLSIIVVLMISNAVSAYHRGLTLNQINTVGMALVDDMRAAVQASPGRFNYESDCKSAYEGTSKLNDCIEDKAASFVFIERKAKVRVGSTEFSGEPVYGAFCTGKYSYIWNSGYFFNDRNDYTVQSGVSAATFSYSYIEGGTRRDVATPVTGFKLLKVEDNNRAVCKAAAGVARATPDYMDGVRAGSELGNNFDITCKDLDEYHVPVGVCDAVDKDTIDTDILDKNKGYGGMALYDLTAMPPASSPGTNNLFYAVSFILGTVQGGINVNTSGNYCATPEGYNASVENFDYCAINKFNFAAQATGG